ncbi:MAG: ABC transporter permease, partial [Balneolaceae bacterium]
MLKNYFKIAWRNILQHKSYSIINIFGLMIGMCACILIGLYVKEELSFDNFHQNGDRIAAISTDHAFFGYMLSTPFPLADAINSQISEAEAATRLNHSNPLKLGVDENNFVEIDNIRYAEPSFFDVFSYQLIQGNEQQSLAAPNQIILTEESSRNLFGNNNPIGKNIAWVKQDTMIYLEVTGVIENPPVNTAIPFNGLLSFNTLSENQRPVNGWGMYSFSTYVLFNNQKALQQSSEDLEAIAGANHDNDVPVFSAIPLTELHLSELTYNSGFTGNVKYIYFFTTIALFILLIASVNYINLSTAQVAMRSRETGIRKTLGAKREQITFQFLGESILLALGAYILSVSLSGFALPFFNTLFGTNLVWDESQLFLLYMAFGAILVGGLAGVYPALYLSRFSPSEVLKSKLPSGTSGSFLRKSLVVTQFTIALILITGSLVIYKQIQFTQQKDLGFVGEQVVVIDLPNSQAWKARQSLRDKVISHPGVMEATVANGAPGEFNVRLSHSPERLSADEKADYKEGIAMAPGIVDHNFIDVLDIHLLAGRNFSQSHPSDYDRGYILNKKAAELLGWTPEEAVGRNFNLSNDGEVIGVVENFHISSLHREIEPVVLQMHEGNWFSDGMLLARLQPDRIKETMNFLEAEIAKFSLHQSFNYEFLDDKFNAMYRTELRLGRVVA